MVFASTLSLQQNQQRNHNQRHNQRKMAAPNPRAGNKSHESKNEKEQN